MKALSLIIGGIAASLTLASGAPAGASELPGLGQGASDQAPVLIFGRDMADDSTVLEQAQFLWGGRNYCFYDSGWRGPGYYWCGYAFRRGRGWGGPMGWNGWSWRHGGPAGYRGGYGYGHGQGGHFAGGDRGPGGHFGGGFQGGHEGGEHGGGHAPGGHEGGGGGHEGGRGHEGGGDHPH